MSPPLAPRTPVIRFSRANRHFLHDPEVYKDPMTFNPDRLIPQPGKPAETDPFDYAFGYGRR